MGKRSLRDFRLRNLPKLVLAIALLASVSGGAPTLAAGQTDGGHLHGAGDTFVGEQVPSDATWGVSPLGGGSGAALGTGSFPIARTAGPSAGMAVPSHYVTSPSWSALSRVESVGVSAGDVNGDGYDDVITGQGMSDSLGQSFYTQVDVFYGSDQGLSLKRGWTNLGPNRSVNGYGALPAPAGDVNGDGYDDVIVSWNRSGYGNYDSVWVFYGSAAGLGSTPAVILKSEKADTGFGASVASAGDVNGDGFDDVIIGADSFTGDHGRQGKVYLYLGSANGLVETPAWTALGTAGGEHLGYSLASAGDINRDGYDDVVIGGPSSGCSYCRGQALVYFGSAFGLRTSPAWQAVGGQDEHEFGMSVASAGDINGDGYADIIVGSPAYGISPKGTGHAYAYYGSATGLTTTPACSIVGTSTQPELGRFVSSAGDVNGDGYDDVIVRADDLYDIIPGSDSSEGRAQVYYGSATGLSTVPDWIGASGKTEDGYGHMLAAAGDVNGDGFADAIVGAYAGYHLAGVYVYYGSHSGFARTVAWAVDGTQIKAHLGGSVASAGDVNGDGYDDIIVGASDFDTNLEDAGRALVYYGSAGGPVDNPNWIAEGDQAGARFGATVGPAGDVNGDGYADVLVVAPGYDGGQTDEGCVFVYYGSAAGLSATPAWIREGNVADAGFGVPAATVGDVNGDGYSDVLVGASGYNRAVLYFGSPAGLGDPVWRINFKVISAAGAGDVDGDGHDDMIFSQAGVSWVTFGPYDGPSAAWRFTSGAYAWLGQSVASAGDVNADGYADVVVGASGESLPAWGYRPGAALAFYGSAAGLPAAPSWTMVDTASDDGFGSCVAPGGDVNGDGYDDVIVAANGVIHGQQKYPGRATLVYGSASGLTATSAWQVAGDQDVGGFSQSVASAGDVDGDSYPDIIIGASGRDKFTTNGYDRVWTEATGWAFVYRSLAGPGLLARLQQRRADDSAPIGPGGSAASPNSFRVLGIAYSPWGRSDVRLQWEIKERSILFDGTGLGESAWRDSGDAGYAFNELVTGLPLDRRFHWRARVIARRDGSDLQTSPWVYGGAFFTALTGQQPISGTGETPLLGQAAYVDVKQQGNPRLTSLSITGHPDTRHPQANTAGGLSDGTRALSRYFAIVPNAGAAGYELTLCLDYENSEVAGAGATEDKLGLCRRDGSAWQCYARGAGSDPASNLVCADGVTALSDWILAGPAAPGSTPTPTATSSSTPTPTATPSPTATLTPTLTPTPSETPGAGHSRIYLPLLQQGDGG